MKTAVLKLQITPDPEGAMAYVYYKPSQTVGKTTRLDEWTWVDWTADGAVIGIELSKITETTTDVCRRFAREHEMDFPADAEFEVAEVAK